MRRSTRWATWLGQGIAWMLILGGAVMVFGLNLPVLGGGVLNGLWLIFIGIFLNNAALGGYRQMVMDGQLAKVQVRSVMQTRVPMISSDASLGELLSRNLTQPDGYTLFVTEGQDVVGVVAMKDMKDLIPDRWPATTVADVMTPISELLYVSADEDVVNALEHLQRLDLRHIPVMLNDRIVGLLHRKDVHRLLQLHSELIP